MKALLTITTLALMFVFYVPAYALSCPVGYIVAGDDTPHPSCREINVKYDTETSVDTNVNIRDGVGSLIVYFTPSKEHVNSVWGSTQYSFAGGDNVCINHGNNPLLTSQAYSEQFNVKMDGKDENIDVFVRPFSDDICATPLTEGLATTLHTKVVPGCLNCDNGDTDVVEEESDGEVQEAPTIQTSTPSDETVRSERREKLNAYISAHQHDPGFADMISLIKLLIALHIIEL